MSFGYIYCSSGGWRLKLVGTHCFGGDYDNGGLRVTGVGTSVTIEGGTCTPIAVLSNEKTIVNLKNGVIDTKMNGKSVKAAIVINS